VVKGGELIGLQLFAKVEDSPAIWSGPQALRGDLGLRGDRGGGEVEGAGGLCRRTPGQSEGYLLWDFSSLKPFEWNQSFGRSSGQGRRQRRSSGAGESSGRELSNALH